MKQLFKDFDLFIWSLNAIVFIAWVAGFHELVQIIHTGSFNTFANGGLAIAFLFASKEYTFGELKKVFKGAASEVSYRLERVENELHCLEMELKNIRNNLSS
jgi:hypothetical protein